VNNVLVADDHEVTRRGVRSILEDAFARVDVQEVGNGASLLAALPTRAWDLILLDVMMPGESVIDLLRKIRAFSPTVPVLMLTAALELEYIIQTMRAGANGLIHKHRASDELLTAIKTVSAGGMYLHPETANAVAAALRAPEPGSLHQRLSLREREIFGLIAQGHSVKQIAVELRLSEKTVATYLARIRDKTGLSSHVDMARYALQHKLVH